MKRTIFSLLSIIIVFTGSAGAVMFDHKMHDTFLDTPECSLCHVENAFSVVPDKEVCTECHEREFAESVEYPKLTTHDPVWAFNHRLEARMETVDCSECHDQAYCMECHQAGFADEMGQIGNRMANIHRAEFQVTHPIAARTDQQLCARCHENRFCVDCHERFSPADLAIQSHRRGFSDNTFSGQHAFFTEAQCAGCHPSGSVLPSSTGWTAAHAREARRNLATCQSCHPDGDICLKCHSAVTGLGINPHPEDWNDMSDNLRRASDGRTCRRCH